MAEIIVKQKANKLQGIPLSAIFLESHIENIAEDTKKQILEQITQYWPCIRVKVQMSLTCLSLWYLLAFISMVTFLENCFFLRHFKEKSC